MLGLTEKTGFVTVDKVCLPAARCVATDWEPPGDRSLRCRAVLPIQVSVAGIISSDGVSLQLQRTLGTDEL